MKKSFWSSLSLIFTLTWASGATFVQKNDHGILVGTDSLVVKIQPWSPQTVRVEAAPAATIPEKKSLAVIAAPNPAGWKVTEDATTVQLKGKGLRVVVNKQTGLVSFFDAAGKLLLEQKAWQFKPAQNAARNGLELGVTFVRQPGEHFFGGGVIGDDLRQPQATIPLQNDYLQIHIPILYSSLGYGFFWDNPSRGKLSTTPDSVTWQASAGDLADFYFMAGPQADAVVAEYRHLTGAAPMFPEWAYGFWYSRNKFSSQQEILNAAQKFRAEQVPVDLLIQDYFYWKPDGSHDNAANWGSHQFDPVRYPDPKGMIDTLHNQDHVHFMSVIWGKFNPETAHYQELDKAGSLFPAGHDWAGPGLRYYDPFDPTARSIYGHQVMDSLLSLGQDAFWMDGAEPEMDMARFAAFDSTAGPVSRLMDAFPLMHTTAIYQAQRLATSDKRVVLLPRSAWPGEQRNAACAWTSDIQQNWHDFTWQIEGLQNYSICGLPYVTTDVGGYSPTAESDRELFVRWFEWGTFCPIFRVHGIDRPFPWEYGNEGATIFQKFDRLRYRLLPYIYSQAAQITFESGTLMRPLVMDFRDDSRAVTQWDEFMFGPSFLVCPVYQCSRELVGKVGDFADQDGKTGGVTATYVKTGGQSVVARKDLKDGLHFTRNATGDQRGQSSIRIEGTYTPKTDGALAFQVAEPHAESRSVTGTINGQAMTPALNGDWQFPLFPFQAQTGVPVHFSLETKMPEPAFQVVQVASAPLHRNVYLPGKNDWYDFWTGERITAGQTLSVATPLNMIPLYVRAGTILPLGPVVQYASEKPADPIELRIYRGADGSFKLYEDQGDNYNYEKGAFSEIPITWNEVSQTLTFGKRKGSFPGMLAQRTFDVVWVSAGHGAAGQVTEKNDAEVQYQGRAVVIKAPRN